VTTRVSRRERSFEEAMERLEAIVSEIESDELGLEKQFELFKEGMALARFCDAKLKEVGKSVERATPRRLHEAPDAERKDRRAEPEEDGGAADPFAQGRFH